MGLNFIAYSDNCLSAHHVLEYMQFILLGHKDPLVLMASVVDSLILKSS